MLKIQCFKDLGEKIAKRGRGHVSTPGMGNALVGVRWEDLVPEQFKFCTWTLCTVCWVFAISAQIIFASRISVPAFRGRNQSPLLWSGEKDHSRLAEQTMFFAFSFLLSSYQTAPFCAWLYADSAQTFHLIGFIVLNVLSAPSKPRLVLFFYIFSTSFSGINAFRAGCLLCNIQGSLLLFLSVAAAFSKQYKSIFYLR